MEREDNGALQTARADKLEGCSHGGARIGAAAQRGRREGAAHPRNAVSFGVEGAHGDDLARDGEYPSVPTSRLDRKLAGYARAMVQLHHWPRRERH